MGKIVDTWAKSWTSQCMYLVPRWLFSFSKRRRSCRCNGPYRLTSSKTFSTSSLPDLGWLIHCLALWTDFESSIQSTCCALTTGMPSSGVSSTRSAKFFLLNCHQTVPTKSISAQQSRQIAISLVLRLPKNHSLRRPGTASIRSLLPPHLGQYQSKSVMLILT